MWARLRHPAALQKRSALELWKAETRADLLRAPPPPVAPRRNCPVRIQRLDPALGLVDTSVQDGHPLHRQSGVAIPRALKRALGGVQQRAEFGHVEKSRRALERVDCAQRSLDRFGGVHASLEIEQRLARALGEFAPLFEEIGQQVFAHDASERW